jgi:predicted transcriptional regulator
MKKPDGNLTPVQYHIMEAVWSYGDAGATVVEIWQAVRADRSVGRTTVLNLVDRLEKRGWLVRQRANRPNRYSAAVNRGDTSALLAGEFVNDFFSGSAGNLVLSLLGSKRLSRDEIEQLSKMLDNESSKTNKKQGGRS